MLLSDIGVRKIQLEPILCGYESFIFSYPPTVRLN